MEHKKIISLALAALVALSSAISCGSHGGGGGGGGRGGGARMGGSRSFSGGGARMGGARPAGRSAAARPANRSGAARSGGANRNAANRSGQGQRGRGNWNGGRRSYSYGGRNYYGGWAYGPGGVFGFYAWPFIGFGLGYAAGSNNGGTTINNFNGDQVPQDAELITSDRNADPEALMASRYGG